MLAGGIYAYEMVYLPGKSCNLWMQLSIEDRTFYYLLLIVLLNFGSLTNITIIALQRVHATFYPFKHRVLKKWVYGLTIAVVWVTSGLVTIASKLLHQIEETSY